MKKAIMAVVIITILLMPFAVILLGLLGRLDFYLDITYRSPDKNPGSTWSTSDGEIFFTVTEEEQLRFEAPDASLDSKHSTQDDIKKIETKMFGEINIGETKYKFFVYSAPYAYYMSFISDELPLTSDSYATFFEYELLTFSVGYKSKKHMTAKVESSKIPEIEVGKKFHFYKTDVKQE